MVKKLHEWYKDKFKAKIIFLYNSIFALLKEHWLSDQTLN